MTHTAYTTFRMARRDRRAAAYALAARVLGVIVFLFILGSFLGVAFIARAALLTLAALAS